MRIGIIGGGATGTVVLQQLSEAFARNPRARAISEIVLFDASGFDGGLAYRTASEHHLLNMKTGTMSAVAEDADHFVRWLRSTGRGTSAAEHLPRFLYRRYLDHLRDQTAARCEAVGVRVQLVASDVERLRCIAQDEFSAEIAGGAPFTLGAVVLCTGHNAPEDYFRLAGCRNFCADPYAAPVALADERGIRIGIIGTGLTAIDNALALGQRMRLATVTCISRSGRFPKVQPLVPAWTKPEFRRAIAYYVAEHGTILAEALARRIETALYDASGLRLDFSSAGTEFDGLAQLQRDTEEAETGVATTYSYLATITDLVCDAWRKMEIGEKSRFMQDVYSGWMRNRHAMPLVNARKLRALLRAGRLRLAPGLQGITPDSDGFVARFVDGTAREFNFLISATGPSYSVAGSPLYAEMARSGVVRIDPFGGVTCDHPDGRVRDGAGHPHRHLFAVGSPTRGSFFYAAAMDINVARARSMTESLLSGLTHEAASDLPPLPIAAMPEAAALQELCVEG
jgi:uncharacterized NAD(P)/FAD-binding protein YdhS